MLVLDTALIADIILTGEGFYYAPGLAKKVLYSLAVKQLSKQDHYDFGLRSMAALLRYAGKKTLLNHSFCLQTFANKKWYFECIKDNLYCVNSLLIIRSCGLQS